MIKTLYIAKIRACICVCVPVCCKTAHTHTHTHTYIYIYIYIYIYYTRMLLVILNKSWRQHPTKQQPYGHQSSITKIIKIRRTRHVGHCWRRRDKLISHVLLWTPSHGRAKAGWPARTYIQQPCIDTERSLEDLPGAMDDWEGGQGGSGISMLMVWHDDDDDDILTHL